MASFLTVGKVEDKVNSSSGGSDVPSIWKVTVDADAMKAIGSKQGVRFDYTVTSEDSDGSAVTVKNEIYLDLIYVETGFLVGWPDGEWGKELTGAVLPNAEMKFGSRAEASSEAEALTYEELQKEISDQKITVKYCDSIDSNVSVRHTDETIADPFSDENGYLVISSPETEEVGGEEAEEGGGDEEEGTDDGSDDADPYVSIRFLKTGIYTFTYQEDADAAADSVTVQVGYPELGAYTNELLSDDGFIDGEYTYKTDAFKIYLVQNPSDGQTLSIPSSGVLDGKSFDNNGTVCAWEKIYDEEGLPGYKAVDSEIIEISTPGSNDGNNSAYVLTVDMSKSAKENLDIVIPYEVKDSEGDSEVRGVHLTLTQDCSGENGSTDQGGSDVSGGSPVIEATGTEQADGTIKFDLAKDQPAQEVTYSAAAVTVPVTLQVKDVSGNAVTLAEGTDYKVKYVSNKEVGTMTAVITGIGEYKNKISENIPVTIQARDITDAAASGVAIEDLVFTAKQAGKAKAKPAVYYNGKKLKLGKDYQLLVNGQEYNGKTALDASVTSITVKGIGNFKGERTVSITYLKADDTRLSLSKAKVSGVKAQSYTGSEVRIDDIIKAGLKLGKGTQPVYGTDYTISYSGNTAVGTAYAVITATAGSTVCTGSKVIAFKITGTAMKTAAVTLKYNGKTISTKKGETVSVLSPATAIVPEVTVTAGGKTLTEGVDYTVTVTKNRKAGTATVTVTGMNGYTGKKTAKFKITK